MDEIFDFRLEKIDIDIELDKNYDCRYFTPKKSKSIPERYLKYKNAQKLGSELKIFKECRYFVFVDGTFFFGDLFETLIEQNNWRVKNLTIQTLSMNENNIDSLNNLIEGDYIENLNLIISDYFYSHERNDLVRYIYEKLDTDMASFQLAVAGSHCKIATIETECGIFLVIHGSANLRSSSNIEQLMIEENENLYNFVNEVSSNILTEYSTINKSLRRNKLWHQVAKEVKDQEGNKEEAVDQQHQIEVFKE
jgi:hypothetical protein